MKFEFLIWSWSGGMATNPTLIPVLNGETPGSLFEFAILITF